MSAGVHKTEDQLELYVLGRLPEDEIEETEGHLLTCEGCREKLDELGAFAPAMREELRKRGYQEEAGFQWFAWLRTAPGFAMAGACATAVLALGIYWTGVGRTLPPMASLTVTAMRGDAKPTVNGARELDINITDAPASGGPFVVEIVDLSGAKIWTGPATGSGQALQVKILRRLSPGDYFARLNGASGEMVHEYAFRVKP